MEEDERRLYDCGKVVAVVKETVDVDSGGNVYVVELGEVRNRRVFNVVFTPSWQGLSCWVVFWGRLYEPTQGSAEILLITPGRRGTEAASGGHRGTSTGIAALSLLPFLPFFKPISRICGVVFGGIRY